MERRIEDLEDKIN